MNDKPQNEKQDEGQESRPSGETVSGRRGFMKAVGVGGAVAGMLASSRIAQAEETVSSPPMTEPVAKRKALVAREPKAVTYESIDNVALITINRPPTNRLNEAALEMLHDAWVRLNKSNDRCAVITGQGNEAFSGGGEPSQMTAESVQEELMMFHWAIPGCAVKLNKPLIGAAAGHVIGGGFTLAMMADMLIAAENTVFWYPEAHASVAGGLIGSLAVRIPHKIAMEIMLVGQPFSVQRAYDVGFVNEIVPTGKQVEAAMKYARHIADNGPLVVSWFKNLADQTLPRGPGEIAAELNGQMRGVLDSQDFAESMSVITSGRKRKPKYRGM